MNILVIIWTWKDDIIRHFNINELSFIRDWTDALTDEIARAKYGIGKVEFTAGTSSILL